MKCCICSAVMNVAQYLPKIISNMKKMGGLFVEYQMIFYYDTSHDGTLNLLHQYEKDDDKMHIIVNTYRNPSFNRTNHIAHARNGILEHVKKNYGDYDFMIMIDADYVCTHPINPSILEKYLMRDDWDGLFFNKSYFYDLWALGLPELPYSMWHYKQPYSFKKYQNTINDKLKKCPEGELVTVLSAFNGFGIYRLEKFKNTYYDGNERLDLVPEFMMKYAEEQLGKKGRFHYDPNANQDCEHRAFHLQAIYNSGARLRISPEILFPNDPDFK